MSTDRDKSCGLTINHQPHWWGGHNNTDHWCNGRKAVKKK